MLKLKRIPGRTEVSVDYAIEINGVQVGAWYFHQLWANTYNVHFDLDRGVLAREKVIKLFHGVVQLLNEAVGAENIIAWVPNNLNRGPGQALLDGGFEIMGCNPDLTFYTYTLEI